MLTEAIIIGADRVARLSPIELPPMTATRVRLETVLGGVSCGTEADATSGRAAYIQPPFVTGYQAVGRVVETGAEVQGLDVGDLVFTEGGGLWPMRSLAGGSHARELVVESVDVTRLTRDNPSLPTTAYAALGAIALEGVMRMRPEAGQGLLVFGLGMLGQLVGRVGQCKGLKVVGVNRSAWKCDVARELGFDAVCAPEPAAIETAVVGLGLDGAKYAVDLTGSQAIFDLALSQLADFGHLSLLGYYPERFSVNFDICHGKQLTLHNPVGLGDHLPQILVWIQDGQLNLEPAIRETIGPAQVNEFYHDLVTNHSRHLGVVIDWQQD